MKTVTLEEINDLYRKCGISDIDSNNPRTSINTGSLNNKLNCNFSFLDKGKVASSVSNNTEKSVKIK